MDRDRIGPYRILDTLGEGGIAVVYLALQSEPIQRRVALKMIKPGMDSAQVVKRFESERQALAVLDHPNIASVFDAGVTDDGLPYFVMELVSGQSVTDYCDGARLSTRQRIRLFGDICAAVQHAHLKGLIHRDIKSSNVLVAEIDGAAVVKVIDFGIAKAVTADKPGENQLTRIGTIVGTPQYMSPEQLGGEDIDTRADVYALGVLLYELLVGAAPIDMTGISLHALAYLIREKEPPTPSGRLRGLTETWDKIAVARATDPGSLVRELKGDLDWIVMKAVAKAREERYETARALAEDLERYLNHQPVAAHPPRTGYLIKRFVRRNRVAVFAGVVAATALVLGAIATTVGFMQARTAEKAAVQEARTSKQIADFLVSVFAVSDPSEAKGNALTAREVLEAGAARIEKDLEDEPDIQATLMFTMAEVYKNLGLYTDATTLSVAALEQRRALGADPLEFADSLDQLGALKKAAGEIGEAQVLHEEALTLRRATGSNPVPAIVMSLQHLAEIEFMRSDYEQSRDLFLEAMEIAETLDEASPALLAELSGNLGALSNRLGDAEAAEVYERRALQGFVEAHGPIHPNVATMQNNLAYSLNTGGRFAEAGELYEESLSTYRELFGDTHPLIANTMNNLALVYLTLDRLDEAESLLSRSLGMYREILGDEHSQVATVQANLGRILLSQGNLVEAERLHRDSLAMQIRLLDPAHFRIANARLTLADTLNGRREFDEAYGLAASAYRTLSEERGEEHPRTARAAAIMGRALTGLERYAEAEPLLIDNYPRIAAGRGDGSVAATRTAEAIILLYENWGKPQLAAEFREQLAPEP